MKTNNKYNSKLIYIIAFSGIIAALFYFAHIFVGRTIWTDFNPFTQPISDLTAKGAISEPIVSKILYGYNFFNLLFCGFLLFYFKKIRPINKTFYLALIIKAAAEVLSTFGYIIFPLNNTEWVGSFQNIMHYLITVFIVVGYIMLSILLTIGIYKDNKHPKMFAFLFLFTIVFISSGFGTVIATQLLPAYVGIVERINIYSIMVLNVILSIWILTLYNKTNLEGAKDGFYNEC